MRGRLVADLFAGALYRLRAAQHASRPPRAGNANERDWFHMVLLVFIAGWMAAGVLCWKWLLPSLLGPDPGMKRAAVISASLAAFIAPGVVIGHGILPLPAGVAAVACIWAETVSPDDFSFWGQFIANVISWLIVSFIFFSRDY